MPRQSGNSVGKARATAPVRASGKIAGGGHTVAGVGMKRGPGIRASGIVPSGGGKADARPPITINPSGVVVSRAERVRRAGDPKNISPSGKTGYGPTTP